MTDSVNRQKSFTLLEMLIVLGVVSILASITVLVLKPAELMREGRDSTRIQDVRNIDNAIVIGRTQNSSLLNNVAYERVYISLPSTDSDINDNCKDDYPSLPILTGTWQYRCNATSTTLQKTDVTGWIPIDFTSIVGGAGISVLPIDPKNNTANSLYYAFSLRDVNKNGYSLSSVLESEKYLAKTAANDGGNATSSFETAPIAWTTVTASAPTVTASAATDITSSTATLNGSANPNGDATTGWFRYSATNPGSCDDSFGTSTPSTALGSGNVAVNYSENISGLTMNTTYYFCAIAENSYGKEFGSVLSFPTSGLAGRYWVGGTGNWNDTAHWSASSGGASGASVPTSADDVYFDANSFTATSQTVTLNVAASTKNMNWTGVINSPTLAGTSALNIAGSLTLVSGMTRTYTGAITFSTTSMGQTITLAGKTLGGSVTFDGIGGGWIMQDTFNVGTQTITLTNGSLNTNNQTITCGAFSSNNPNTRSLTLGSSSIICSAITAWNVVNSLTFDAGTSQITFTGAGFFYGGGLAYNNVTFNGVGTISIVNANTFANLTRNGTAAATDQLILYNNQTTGNLALTGNSAVNRLLVQSNFAGTPVTITATLSVSVSNVDFKDITAAGTIPFSGTSLGNALGNSNINFTAAVTRYWVGNGGSWNSTTKWSASSGGASGASVPLPHDTVIFDANSITSAGQTIVANMPRLGANIDFNAVVNSPTLSFNSLANTIFGSLTLGSITSGMTISGTQGLTFSARSPANLTNNSRTFSNAITIDAPGGTITMQDAFNSDSSLTLTRGTLNANNQNITTTIFSSSNSNTRTINMGNGTWTLTGIGTVWNTVTGATYLTLNANASTIKITNTSATARTFSGGGKAYNNFWSSAGASTASLTIAGSNTFLDFMDDGSAAHSILFTAGTTQTVTTFTVSGTAGNLITINSTTTGTHTLSKATDVVSRNYLNIQHSIATGGATWSAGANSINNQSVPTAGSGWTF